MSTIWFLILLSFSYTSQAELIQVIQIARHAARTPLARQFQIKQFGLPPGEITSFGVTQAYYLGREMRTRYMENRDFLPKSDDPSKVLIMSSGKPRTLTSVMAFVNGLYPQDDGDIVSNERFAHVPVESLLPLKKKENVLKQSDIKNVKLNKEFSDKIVQVVPVKHDQTFHAEDEACPLAEKLMDEVLQSDEVSKLEEFYQGALYPHLLSIMDGLIDPKSLKDITPNMRFARNVLDIYRCGKFHGLSLPTFNKFTLDLLEGLDYYYVYNMKFKDPRIRAIATSNLLNEISNFTRGAELADPTTPKYIFYQAHDRNLQSLAQILFPESKLKDDVDFTLVPFSSTMTFEVHKEGLKSDYYVKVLFNDEPQIIKWCAAHKCPLKQFRFILSKFILDDVGNACQQGISEI